MTYNEAARHILTFGKYNGKNIDAVGTSDAGLRYLDWARGVDAGNSQDRTAIRVYLSDSTIAKELNQLQEMEEK